MDKSVIDTVIRSPLPLGGGDKRGHGAVGKIRERNKKATLQLVDISAVTLLWFLHEAYLALRIPTVFLGCGRSYDANKTSRLKPHNYYVVHQYQFFPKFMLTTKQKKKHIFFFFLLRMLISFQKTNVEVSKV
ncbi:hypothetical protein YC2023_050681 [Brassica napus]